MQHDATQNKGVFHDRQGIRIDCSGVRTRSDTVADSMAQRGGKVSLGTTWPVVDSVPSSPDGPILQVKIGQMRECLIVADQGAACGDGMCGDHQVQRCQNLALPLHPRP